MGTTCGLSGDWETVRGAEVDDGSESFLFNPTLPLVPSNVNSMTELGTGEPYVITPKVKMFTQSEQTNETRDK